jgi:HrpA-like RNA helicase
MHKPSAEQEEILTSVQQGYSVIVDAVAGSGKTTTILFMPYPALLYSMKSSPVPWYLNIS